MFVENNVDRGVVDSTDGTVRFYEVADRSSLFSKSIETSGGYSEHIDRYMYAQTIPRRQ